MKKAEVVKLIEASISLKTVNGAGVKIEIPLQEVLSMLVKKVSALVSEVETLKQERVVKTDAEPVKKIIVEDSHFI